MTTREELRRVTLAIQTVRRLGSVPSIKLRRYRAALIKYRDWERKTKLAETKLSKYDHVVKRYRKIFGEVKAHG